MSNRNTGMRWFADDFDYRANSDDCPELMANLEFVDALPPLTRMLVESNEFFVQMEDNKVSRLVRQRHGENVPWLDPDEMDPEEKQLREDMAEDAMNHVPADAEESAPTSKWDLVFWTEMRRKATEWVKVEKSSPVFPHLRDKRLKGYACNLEKAIQNGIDGRALYLAIQHTLKGLLTAPQIARLWELYKIAKFLNKKGE